MSEELIINGSIRRRLDDFRHQAGNNGDAALHLAYHAALPVVLNADLVHLLRINFFLDPPEVLPYTAEADLLLSSICHEIGGDLYEIDPEVRNVLLAGLAREYDQRVGQLHETRVHAVAALLWQYIERHSPWIDRPELERAQQLTALHFLDHLKARRWMEEAEQGVRQNALVERQWFVAMSEEIDKLAEIGQSRSEDSDRKLNDLRLPKAFVNLLLPRLDEWGLQIIEDTRESSSKRAKPTKRNRQTLTYHVIINDLGERILLYIPTRALLDPTASSSGELRDILATFSNNSNIYIVSEGLTKLTPSFNRLFTTKNVTHITWTSVAALAAAEDLNSRKRLQKLFHLEKLISPQPEQLQRRTVNVYLSYSHRDQYRATQLKKHLATMVYSKRIQLWDDGKLGAESNSKAEIESHMNSVEVALLLVSANYLTSKHTLKEMKYFRQQSEQSNVRVILVILEPCDWRSPWHVNVHVLPNNGVPISNYASQDRAYFDVASGVRQVVVELAKTGATHAGAATTRATTLDELKPNQQSLEFYLLAFAIAVEHGNKEQEAFACQRLGTIYAKAGNNEYALDYLQRALTIMRKLNDRAEEASILAKLAAIYAKQLKYPNAISYYQRSLEIYRWLQNFEEVVYTLQQLAKLEQLQGNVEEARKFYRGSISTAERSGNLNAAVHSLRQFGGLEYQQGDIEEGRRLYMEAASTAQRSGNLNAAAASLQQLAKLEWEQGHINESRRFYMEAIFMAERSGNLNAAASSLQQLAKLERQQGNVQESQRFYRDSISTAERSGNLSTVAASLQQLAKLEWEQGHINESRRFYMEAIFMAERSGNLNAAASSLRQLAALEQQQGDTEEARRLYMEAIFMAKRSGNLSAVASSLRQLAALEQQQGDTEEARRLYREAISMAQKSGDLSAVASSLRQFGGFEHQLGNMQEALAAYDHSIQIAPNNSRNWYSRGIVYKDMGRFEEALADFDQSLQLDPTLDVARVARYQLLEQ